ncbi:MAG: hypothetical protein JJU13_21450 [Balneolaceae bacterium]|nr:hypothetical protein [Balneolaceae bacterium]
MFRSSEFLVPALCSGTPLKLLCCVKPNASIEVPYSGSGAAGEVFRSGAAKQVGGSIPQWVSSGSKSRPAKLNVPGQPFPRWS